MRRPALVAVLLAALALVLPGAGLAITRDEATRIALQRLTPEQDGPRVVVFALPGPLGPKQSVVEASPARLGNIPAAGKLEPLGRKVWLFWEDLAYDALFAHPGRMLLVDDATGKIAVDRRTSWYPLVDGLKPAYLRTREEYADPAYQIFSSLPAVTPREFRLPAGFTPGSALPAGAFKDDCLILMTDWGDPRFDGSIDAMAKLASSQGIRVYYGSASAASDFAPSTTKPPRDHVVSGYSLVLNVSYLTQKLNCKDVIVYVAGHGIPEKDVMTSGGELTSGGPAGILVGNRNEVTPANLETILRNNKLAERKATFKFVIMGCFSGRFQSALADDLTPSSGLRVVATSSKADQFSWFKGGVTNAAGEPLAPEVDTGAGDWFTNGLIAGMQKFVNSNAEVTLAQKAGGSLAARMIERAVPLGLASNLTAFSGSPGSVFRTDPVVTTNFPTGDEVASAAGSPVIYQQATAGGDYDIFFDRVDGAPPVNLTDTDSADEFNPDLSPDGTDAVWQVDDSGTFDIELGELDGDTVQTRRLTSSGATDRAPEFCTEGVGGKVFVVFQTNRDGNAEIYRIELDGTGLRNLSNDPTAQDRDPTCAPDGRIAWSKDGNAEPGIYEYNPATGVIANLLRGQLRYPDYGPRGTRMAFSEPDSNNLEVWLADFTTRAVRKLTDTASPLNNFQPTFTPDGGGVLVTRTDALSGGNEWIVLVDEVYGPGPVAETTVTLPGSVRNSAPHAQGRCELVSGPGDYTELWIYGTGLDDAITTRSLASGRVSVVLNGVEACELPIPSRIVAYGLEGDDRIRNDTGVPMDAAGGDGDDVLAGGPRGDLLVGGAGRDVIQGKKGNDALAGGPGDDALDGGSGADLVDGGDGIDTATTGKGDAVVGVERAPGAIAQRRVF
jgi:Tol biopolymer transport system component